MLTRLEILVLDLSPDFESRILVVLKMCYEIHLLDSSLACLFECLWLEIIATPVSTNLIVSTGTMPVFS